ncbi:hypothetical protein [Sulfitobacter sp. KE37]|uniref:plasmid mobilization protein n=2 Tax=Sulfitobacter TaxID=60136 RepID=UPI0023E184A6|nr:hypothetical protein [Sulfitobacter sp. KE37]
MKKQAMLLTQLLAKSVAWWLRRLVMRRTKQLKVTLSDSEYDALARRSKEFGVSMAGVIRSAVLGLPLPRRRVKVELEAVAALNRIGSNLNQLVCTANATGCLTPAQVSATGGVLKRVRALAKLIEGESKQ